MTSDNKAAANGVENKILRKIIDDRLVYGCISMPSNVFANTGTNVSVLFFDKAKKVDKVVLIDASSLGEEYQEGNNKKNRLRESEIDLIIDTFIYAKEVKEFSVVVSYEKLKERYSLAAGQYFPVEFKNEVIDEEEYKATTSPFIKKFSEYTESVRESGLAIIKTKL